MNTSIVNLFMRGYNPPHSIIYISKNYIRNFLKCFCILALLLLNKIDASSQPAPAVVENIPFLVTFGNNSERSWGDDDFCQIFFLLVPPSQTKPVFVRIFDPDTGGEWDEGKGEFNTQTTFSIYGRKGCWSNNDAQGTDPIGDYKSGVLLASKSFKADKTYDNSWYTFGPFNPYEGEYVEEFNGRVFKLIAEGTEGNDGNLYKYFLSSEQDRNKEIEGGNVFTYEYTFRLSNNQNDISQIYPFIDNKTISVEISNFDWDNDGFIRVVSVAKNGELCDISGENNWASTKFPVVEDEKNTSFEIQFVKNHSTLIKNNNVVVIVRNQYGQSLPFFVLPIGGIPVYNPKIHMKPINK